MTHTNTEGLSDADPVRLHVEAMQRMATAYLVPEPYIDLSGNRYPEPDFNHADHIKQELRNAMTMAFANDMLHMLDGPEQRAAFALSRRSASNTGGVEVRAVENALAMLSELQQERSDGAVYEDAVREKAGFYANVIRSLLAAVNSAQSKAASLNGLVSLALRELDALGAETVPVQIRNGLSVLSSLAAEAEPVARPSYDAISTMVHACRERQKAAGEGDQMLSRWISEGLDGLYTRSSSVSAEVTATHRHVKRGTEYVLIGFGKVQAEWWLDELLPDPERGNQSVDMREVAVYRSVDDGSLWVRPREEFEDGRFVSLSAINGGRENG